MVKHMTIPQLRERIQQEDWTILDVRSRNEWNSGHIQGSINISITSLVFNKNKIPQDKPVAVICQSGSRSSLASRILENMGRHSVYDVPSGMSWWKRSHYPMVTA